MIPVKLIEDFAPRLTFLDEFASRCPITPNFFPSTPSSARWDSDSLICNCAYCCEEECTHDNPSSRMSILALKGRCLAMCLYSNSVVLESKKKSFFFWNAWVSKSEHSRLLRKAKLVAAKRRHSALCSSTFRALLSVTSVLRNLRLKDRMLVNRSRSILCSRVIQDWRHFSMNSRVNGDVKECKQDPRKNQNSPLQLSTCISKSHLKKFRMGASALRSMPMKFLLMYGASLSRILRTWAEFSWQHRFEISSRIRYQQRSLLNCVMRAWIYAYNELETVIFMHKIRGVEDLKIAAFSHWRDVYREGWKQLVYDLFEKNPELQLDDKASLPRSCQAESMPEMFERSLITLGQMQFRITRKALDSWKEELNRIFSIKMMINNSRGKHAKQVLDVWYKAMEVLSEKRKAALKMVNSVQHLSSVWRRWRASVSALFTSLRKEKWTKQAQGRLDMLVRVQFRKWRSKAILSHFYSQRAMPYGVISLLKRSHDRIQHAFFHGWLFCTMEIQTLMIQSSQASINIGKALVRRDSRIFHLAFQKLRHNAVETVLRRKMEWKLACKVAMIKMRFAVVTWSQHHFRSKICQHISSKILKVHENRIHSRTLNSWCLSVLNLRKIQNTLLAQSLKGKAKILTKFFSGWVSGGNRQLLVLRKTLSAITARHRACIIKCIGKIREYTHRCKRRKRIISRTEEHRRRKCVVQTFQIFFEHSKIRTECLVWIHQRMKKKLTLMSALLQWQFRTSSSLATIEANAQKHKFHLQVGVRGAAQKNYNTRAQSFQAWKRTTHKHRKLSATQKFQIHKQNRRGLLRFFKAWQLIGRVSSSIRWSSCTLEIRGQFRLKNQTFIEWRRWVSKSCNTKVFIGQTHAMISHRISCRAWITWILQTSASAEIFHRADVLYSQKKQAVVFRAWILWMMHTNSAVEAREQVKALNIKQMIVPKDQLQLESENADEKYFPDVYADIFSESFITVKVASQPDDVSVAHKCKLLDNISQRQRRRLLTTAVVEWHNFALVRASCPPLPKTSSSTFIVSC
jgi:hypothetical protein